jgi:hypothetical protein
MSTFIEQLCYSDTTFLCDVHDIMQLWWSRWHWGLKLGRRNSGSLHVWWGNSFHHHFSELQKSVFIDLWCSHSMLQLTGYLLISHWMLNTGETACHAGWVQLLVLRKRWGEVSTQGMYQIPHYFWTSDISVIYLFCIPQVSCLGKRRSSCLTS